MTPPIKEWPQKTQRRGRVLSFGCGGTAAVLTLALFAYLKWANTLPPPEAAPPRVLPSPNGYHARITATNALVALDDGSVKWQPPWNAKLETLRRVLARRKAPLNRLRTALRQPCYAPSFDLIPEYVGDPNLEYPFLLFWAEARVARADGRYAEAMSASLDAVELGVKMGRGGSLFHCFQGHNSEWGVEAGESVVDSLTAAEARKAGHRLDRILRELPTIAEALEVQRPLQLARWRRVLLSNPSSPTDPEWLSDWHGLVHAFYPKSWAYAQLNRYSLELTEVARRPYYLRRFSPFVMQGNSAHLGGGILWVNDEGFWPGDVSHSFAENEALLRMLRVRLALQEYRRIHSKWPSSLRDAGTQIDNASLTDPFSGAPFRYRRQAGGFMLYSIGPDMRDDRGTSLDSSAGLPEAKGDLVSGQRSWRRLGQYGPT